MKRRLFNVFSTISLLLFVAVVVMWVRSYFVSDLLSCTKPWTQPQAGGQTELRQRVIILGSSEGSLFCTVQNWCSVNPALPLPQANRGPQLSLFHTRVPVAPAPGVRYLWNKMGFRLGTLEQGTTASWHGRLLGGAVPWWAVAVACAVLPGLRVVAVVQRRRTPVIGCCARCGYDIRATPERCPECGAVAATKALA